MQYINICIYTHPNQNLVLQINEIVRAHCLYLVKYKYPKRRFTIQSVNPPHNDGGVLCRAARSLCIPVEL